MSLEKQTRQDITLDEQVVRLAQQVVGLAEVSRFYGSNPEYIVAGGGNTSCKDKNFLFIKPSGTSMDKIKAEDFVKMDRASLGAIWNKNYPSDTDAREAAVLSDMMASRCPGQERRPSVETLLHDILPFTFVVHTHPALVNGLTCSVEGEAAAKRLFPGSLWIPLINPGYILSKAVWDALNALRAKDSAALASNVVIFLQNHGIFVAANSIEEINKIYEKVMKTLGGYVKRTPDFREAGSPAAFNTGLPGSLFPTESFELGKSWNIGNMILETAGKYKPDSEWFIKSGNNNQIAAFTANRAAFRPVSSAFTPDHIVYSGSDPLFIEDASCLEEVFISHAEKTRIPKIIAIQGIGVFALGNSERAVENALDAFFDTVKIAVFSESFGGPLFMYDEMIRFINNWEVERYRSSVAS